jgi:hypothetical protein
VLLWQLELHTATKHPGWGPLGEDLMRVVYRRVGGQAPGD